MIKNTLGSNIIVNYHHVQDPISDHDETFPCSPDDFDQQIKFLKNEYKIATVSEVFEAAKSESKERVCAITFDDGLKDQYRYALPLLKKHECFGTFFIITSVFDGRIPTAYRIHVLLEKLSVSNAIEAFQNFIAEFYPDVKEKFSVSQIERLTSRRMHEDIATANFKEVMMLVPKIIRDRFFNHSFKILNVDEKEIAQNLFLSKGEVWNLKNVGMIIGNHSHNHYAFDLLQEDAAKKDIELSQKILSEIIGYKPQIFSYPHGRNREYLNEIFTRSSIQYAVTIERRDVANNDHLFLLPRYDAADIKQFLANQS